MDKNDRERALRFLRTCQGYLETENFHSLYELADKDLETRSVTGCVTQLLLDAGINSLDYIDYVPKDCFFGLDMYGFVLPDHIRSIDSFSFAYTTNLKTINLKNVRLIGESSFNGSDLETLTIPGSIEVIPAEAFNRCENLKKVVLEEGVEYINDSAFMKCSALKELYLPSTLVYIHEHAFYSDRYLSDIYYNGTKEAVINVWPEAIDGLGDYTIHCTDGDLDYLDL